MDLEFGKNLILRRGAPKLLKISWIIVICASIWGLGYYVSENYIKLRIDPEVLIKAQYVNSRTIPFPAVTICPPNEVNMNFLNLTKFFEDVNKNKTTELQDRKILTAVSQVCPKIYLGMVYFFRNKTFDDDNIVNIFNKFSPEIDDVFESCVVSSQIKCSKVFIQSSTFLGKCFSFNMQGYHTIFKSNISADFDGYKRKNITKSWNPNANVEYHDDDIDNEHSNWTINDGYSLDDDWIQPLRAAGLQFFEIETKFNNNELANFCPNNYQSYRVILHLPNEIPTFSNIFTTLAVGDFKYMRISAQIHKLDESLKKYPPDFRKCFFENEKQLKFLKSYTKLNCELECMTNFTYKTCGCVAFWMPRTNDMNVCKFEKIECFSKIYYNWASSYYVDDENKQKFKEFPCDCFPTCEQIKYTIINDFSLRHDQASINATHSSFQLAFGDSQILESTNYVTCKLQNFVSDIGGLAGLFLGFSLLSLFELILRVCAILRKIANQINIKINKLKKRDQKAQRRRIHQNEVTIMMPETYFGEHIVALR